MTLHLRIVLLGVLFAANDGYGLAVDHGRRVVCFLASWGVHLSAEARFDIPDAEPAVDMCSHVVYLFASLDGDSFVLKYADASRDIGMGGIAKTVALRKKHPHVKILIGIGGWNDGSINYSNMVKRKESRTTFVKSVLKFLLEHSLDGMDLNWQFPGDRGGGIEDKNNIVLLVKELREALDTHNLILSVSVSAIPWRMNLGIKGKELAEHAHFLNILAYEYHNWGEGKISPGAPLYSQDELNINHTITLYLNMGVDPSKLNLGLSNYLAAYIALEAIPNNTFSITGTPTKSYTFKGPLSGVDGFIAYNEFCKEADIKDKWRFALDDPSKTVYAISDDKVVSFDIGATYGAKVRYAMEHKLGGVLYYGLEKDDFRSSCESSKGMKYPILRAIDKNLMDYSYLVYDDLLQLFQKHNAHYFWNGLRD